MTQVVLRAEPELSFIGSLSMSVLGLLVLMFFMLMITAAVWTFLNWVLDRISDTWNEMKRVRGDFEFMKREKVE